MRQRHGVPLDVQHVVDQALQLGESGAAEPVRQRVGNGRHQLGGGPTARACRLAVPPRPHPGR
ncbi:hypothetical protein LT493_04405 [Streptomyces tricolor]|nr:hypothetical protein [Streptomyces tricolor]